jgi:copper chaperone CopZ
MRRTIDFVVTGEEKLYCAGCEQRVGNVLHRLAGVETVQASVETQHVVVTFDAGKIGPEQLRARLEQLGYRVTFQESPA